MFFKSNHIFNYIKLMLLNLSYLPLLFDNQYSLSLFLQIKRSPHSKFALGFCIAATVLIVAVRAYVARKPKYQRQGSVADLVRRGQLNSDRRGMYDSNPFLHFPLFSINFSIVHYKMSKIPFISISCL